MKSESSSTEFYFDCGKIREDAAPTRNGTSITLNDLLSVNPVLNFVYNTLDTTFNTGNNDQKSIIAHQLNLTNKSTNGKVN